MSKNKTKIEGVSIDLDAFKGATKESIAASEIFSSLPPEKQGPATEQLLLELNPPPAEEKVEKEED